ncbi:MAG: ribonuclease R [Clostridia bacterium]|nr:ribonuclease R [Clostridia bacterium]
MKQKPHHGHHGKTAQARSEKPRYVRRISLDDFAPTVAPADDGASLMTVKGMIRGDVRLEAEDGTQYLCSRENAVGALFGDTVCAKIISRDRAVVLRIEKHAHEQIVGLLKRHQGRLVILPLERRLPEMIDVIDVTCDAQRGDIVLTRVVSWEGEGGLMVEAIERVGSFKMAKHAIDALILTERLPVQFDEEALRQANACREAEPGDDPQREDLRGLMSFTIDGRDAKDFDDAVSIEHIGDGCVRLGVHIADVGHYVPVGTPLDREAYIRGTSVYFPGRVLPMLPERLSNGVCSLRPDEDKYTLSAFMDIDDNGEVLSSRFARTITRSKARLIYDEVNDLFDGDAQMREKMAEVEAPLRAMRELAGKIRAKREKQGAIDFDADEPKFVLDEEGEPVEIVKRARGIAEMMIEDFMLTANEAVAKFAKAKGIPLLYRVHERPDPDKLAAFAEFLAPLGVNTRPLAHNAKPSDIRAILTKTRAWPEFSVISALALRAMAKARYDASPLGHYGLALEDYCHFTSPIRRYPDLVVSRAITAALRGERFPMKGDALADAAQQSSDRERAAVEAERMADKIMMARVMASHVGEMTEGVVSGVTEWGVYVSLTNGAEGFVHVRTLDDWFDFDERKMTLRGERTGFVFSLGQTLRVRVEFVDLTQSTIDLSLADSLRQPRKQQSAKKRERARIRGFLR